LRFLRLTGYICGQALKPYNALPPTPVLHTQLSLHLSSGAGTFGLRPQYDGTHSERISDITITFSVIVIPSIPIRIYVLPTVHMNEWSMYVCVCTTTGDICLEL